MTDNIFIPSGEPERLLGKWRVGDHRRARIQARHQVQLLRGDLHGHHLLLLHPPTAPLLHHQPHHPLPPYLLPHSAGLLPPLRLWREGHPMYLRPPLPHRVPAGHHRDHPLDVTRHPADWRIPPLYHDLCHAQHRHHRLCAERALSHTDDPHHAGVGEVCVPQGAAQGDVNEEAHWPGLLLPDPGSRSDRRRK